MTYRAVRKKSQRPGREKLSTDPVAAIRKNRVIPGTKRKKGRAAGKIGHDAVTYRRGEGRAAAKATNKTARQLYYKTPESKRKGAEIERCYMKRY